MSGSVQNVPCGTTLIAVAEQGPRGAPGTAVSASFVESSPSTTWTIAHNLARYPVVVCVDSAGEVIFGDTVYVDDNNVRVGFAAPTSGTAYLN